MNLRAYADNVLIVFEPLASQTKSGIILPPSRKGEEHRVATVLRVGPGYQRPCCGCFVPTTVKPGDKVIVGRLAGEDYGLDVSAPRQNVNQEFQELLGIRGQFRVVREEEILAVVEDAVEDDTTEAAAAAE